MSEIKRGQTRVGAHRAAVRCSGTTCPAESDVALASLASEDKLGAWLARNWGVLADAPSDLLEQIDL